MRHKAYGATLLLSLGNWVIAIVVWKHQRGYSASPAPQPHLHLHRAVRDRSLRRGRGHRNLCSREVRASACPRRGGARRRPAPTLTQRPTPTLRPSSPAPDAVRVAAEDRAAGAAAKPALFARLIKVEHSVYALPFAYAGAFLAARGLPPVSQLCWITVAMVGARSAAMALNRLIDAELDARNPRTAARELPTGRLGRARSWVFTSASVALLVLAAFHLSPPCRYLWPIPLAAFVLYPYAKRFTWFCHYALGLTLGLAPAAAWSV